MTKNTQKMSGAPTAKPSSAAPCYIASERLEEFKRQTTLQVKLNGMVAASTSLEMLLYIANLERKLIECGIDIEAI
ncbi:MAG: hypothetical protein DRP56_09050 [Planctomycetota bacterium]|nr:MAG: hypothetical protein DRP56_09050 [Planctomycetota bacterium]